MTRALHDALADAVAGIGGTPRPGQAVMAEQVSHSLAQGRHLLVQAGTGTGKSFGYLIPAALFSLNGDSRVLVSTATLALQRQLMTKDLPSVVAAVARAAGRAPATALVKGRGNYLCRLRLAETGPGGGSASQEALELPGRLERQSDTVRRWALQTRTGDRDDLPSPVDARVWAALSVSGRECLGRQKCPFGSTCFAETAKDAAANADIVVTNHTLLAIDVAGGSSVLPDFAAAVVDEAHDFGARLTAAATASLTVPGLRELARASGAMVDAQVLHDCTAAVEGYATALAATEGGPGGRLLDLPEPLTRALAVLRDSLYLALTNLATLENEISPSRRQRVLAGLEDSHDLCGALLEADAGLVRWLGSDPLGLTHAPIRVADRISSGLLSRATVVATSATLKVGGSFAALAAEWGLAGPGIDLGRRGSDQPSPWASIDVGSPFDYPSQAILYLPTDLPAPGIGPISAAALERICALVAAAGGRTLVLASTWRSVDAIAAHLSGAISGANLLVQQRSSPVALLIGQFAQDEHSVLVGTMSLWQGVDVPGSACTCVVMDKIPFPRPDDPVHAARSEAAAEAGASGFAAVALPHAALLLAQGAGRLIRSDTDRGVIAILDTRITTKRYGQYLLAGLPDGWRTSRTEEVLAALRRLDAPSDAP